jgi:two-component system cell cycle response regulator
MRILVADDDPVSALVLRRALERLGHDVAVAASGLEALELFGRDPRPVLVSDWMMPGLDGLTLCERVRAASDSYTYVILLTAKTQKADRLRAIEAGVDDFLTKPLDLPDLASRVRVAERIITWQRQLQQVNESLVASSRALAEQAEEIDRMRREAEYLASHDSLTGLLNRRAWFEAAEFGAHTSLAVFDIDHFKAINDRYGHPAGDAVLEQLSARMLAASGGGALIGRLGGEEFGVLFADEIPAAETAARALVSAVLDRPFRLPNGVELALSMSGGFAPFPGGRRPAQQAVAIAYDAADQALYAAKDAGRGRLFVSLREAA